MSDPPAPTVPPPSPAAGSRGARPPSALPAGTRLGEYEIKRVLGIGGFGIVYLAFDHALEREVAVKEYMPQSLADRTDTMHVSLRSAGDEETFAMGLRSFVNEARMLAHFDHPSLLKVHRFWEANGTAYMVMPLYRGRTLKEVAVELGQAPSEAWLRQMLAPLLGALDLMHKEGVFHRDISPDNILIEGDGHPVLLDFGAARRVIADRSQTLTAILKPSYAPIEQYAETSTIRQGPWTDIYALGATLHFMLLGRPPPPATTRAIHDEMERLAQRGVKDCSREFLATIDWMLAPKPGERASTIAVVRDALEGRITPPERGETTVPIQRPPMPAVDPELANAPTAITRPPRPAEKPAPTAAQTAMPVASGSAAGVPAPAPDEVTVRVSEPAVAATPAPAVGDEATVVLPRARPMPAKSPTPRPAEHKPVPWLLGGGIAGAALLLAGMWWLLQRPAPEPAAGSAAAAASAAPLSAERAASAAAASASAAAPTATTGKAVPAGSITAPGAAAAASRPGIQPGAQRPLPAPAAASAARTPVPRGGAPAAAPVVLPSAKPEAAAAERPRSGSAPSAVSRTPSTPASPSAPAPAVLAPSSPKAACANLGFFANHNCMRRTCNTPQWIEHPECENWRTDRPSQ